MKLTDPYKIQFEKSGNTYSLTGNDIASLSEDNSLVIGRALIGKITPQDQDELHEYLVNLKNTGSTLVYKDGEVVPKSNS